MNKRIYINASIPYVNGLPHIGHALELVQCDTFARAHRLFGSDTYFVWGSDENAQKNVESAEKLGITTQELVDKHTQAFIDLKNTFNLTFDDFIRTTADKHKRGAQKFWKLCEKDIYKKTYHGLYCVGCETFYKDDELPDNVCPNHNRKLETVSEENYFFALSKYQTQLEEIITSDRLKILPEFKRHEILNFIKKGLEDFSISRPNERMKGWGVEVPGDPSQRMYVWFDALTNYITALNFADDGELFKKYWLANENRINVIGKDIIKFHSIYWVAMLLSANLPLPTRQFVHGFITSGGQKMSKTLGNVVDPQSLVTQYGMDAVRYYLLKEIPALDDGDFSYDRMNQLYSSDLANELGNTVSRITTIAEKDHVTMNDNNTFEWSAEIINDFENFKFNTILENVWLHIRKLNKDIDDFAPWKKTPEERQEFLRNAIQQINTIGNVLTPFLPTTAEKIIAATQGEIKKVEPLFPRLTK